MKEEIRRRVEADLVKEGSQEYKEIIAKKNEIVAKMWRENTPVINLEIGNYTLEIGLYTGNDHHEFIRSGERVFREICFKHSVSGCKYWVPLEKALKYHKLNIKHFGRDSNNGLDTKDDYFIVKKLN